MPPLTSEEIQDLKNCAFKLLRETLKELSAIVKEGKKSIQS